MRLSLRTLDRLWTGLLAVAIILMVRESAMGSESTASVDPQAIYHTAWQQISRNYVNSSFNGQNWTAWEHKFDGQLTSVDEAKEAIKSMTASLGDRYTRVAQIISAPAAGQQATHGDATAPEASVTSKVMGDVGYIKISSFSSVSMVREFKDNLKSVAASKQLVLDLRGNRGGSVTNALEVADMLLDHGDIMTSVSREGRKTYSATGSAMVANPMVVLVDEYSASAAEILTGALHDNHRAVVLGTKTFGKGVIQEAITLPGSLMLYVTSAHYVTPSGSDINGKGIEPDIKTAEGANALDTAISYLQAHS